jgi:hypothetical protein
MIFRWPRLIGLGAVLLSCSATDAPDSTRRFSGVWLYEFEGSSFIEGATEPPTVRPPYHDTDWLEYSHPEPRLDPFRKGLGYDDDLGCYPVQPILIVFVGRRAHRSGGAGHMGLWRSEVTVDRTVSLEPLGPPICYENQAD